MFPPCLGTFCGVSYDSLACLDLGLLSKASSQAHSRWYPIEPLVSHLLQDGIPNSVRQSPIALSLPLSPALERGVGVWSPTREVSRGNTTCTSYRSLLTESFHNSFTLKTRFYLNSKKKKKKLFMAYASWAKARTRKINLSLY